ncbi:MAG: anthranilate phosphoribosyltransferase [Halobacteriales archaeon]
MTAVVGSGPKSAADMDADQAREAMERIFDGDPDPTTLGAFLLANRWKRNTPEELAAFADVVIERSVDRAKPDVDPVDCGANYDGKTDSALLGVAAGIVAAGAGTPVVAHSGDRVPTHEATAYRHVLDELGVVTDLNPGESADMVDETGFGFYYQPRFNPAIEDLIDRRRAMGVRTFLNTVETLANPAGADIHLGSFYHLPFAKKLADTIEESDRIGFDRAILFQGMEGYDDIRPGHTQVAEWTRGEELKDYGIRTGEYGMEMVEEDLHVESVAGDSARITEAVLSGDREGHFADAIELNGAVRLYAGGDAGSLDEGLEAAREAIDDGSASAVLSDLRSFSG